MRARARRAPQALRVPPAPAHDPRLCGRGRNPHPTRSRDNQGHQVFGRERQAQDRAIDVCVSRLRQHLEDPARQASLIRTVRNAGYVLACDVMPQAG
jgi:two-component system OmpR family response regulator